MNLAYITPGWYMNNDKIRSKNGVGANLQRRDQLEYWFTRRFIILPVCQSIKISPVLHA